MLRSAAALALTTQREDLTVLKKIAIAFAAILVGLVVVVAAQPSRFAIERSIVVAAPAPIVAGHIVNLRAMDEWSPWARMDPRASR
jgi:hypothetical protein